MKIPIYGYHIYYLDTEFMPYSQNELFEIAKKLIIFSAKKTKITKREKEKIIPQLIGILDKNKDDKTLLGKKVHKFLGDILSDIENDRTIDIDTIIEDNYIENFLMAEKYVFSYNSLLQQGDYNSIILSIKEHNIDQAQKIIHRLKNQVKDTLATLNAQKFSELILIINIFHISNILKYYKHMYLYLLENNEYSSSQMVLEIIKMIQEFHILIHQASIKNIENDSIESYYMMCDIKNNKLSFLPIKIVSESNKISKYKQLFTNLFCI